MTRNVSGVLVAALLLGAPFLGAQVRVGELKKLTNISSSESNWSPDGKKIAFYSDRTGDYEIYVMNPDGTGVVQLTNVPGTDDMPAWSPDGTRIAFISDRTGDNEIYLMNADGTNVKRLTEHPGDDIHPKWSPDGQRLLFNSSRESRDQKDPDTYEVYSMKADGTGVQRITREGGVNTYASWSPDGKKIAFRKVVGTNSEIFVMNADGSGHVNLTKSPAFDGWPGWAPDGRRVVFATDMSIPGQQYKIYVVNADGTGLQKLIDKEGRLSVPAWSPDGSRLAFTRSLDGSRDIFVAEVK
jgi:TolB protein